MAEPTHPVLAVGKVRHVGDAVAVVIAETRQQAKDAAERWTSTTRTCPAVASVRDAVKPGAARCTTRCRATSATTGISATRR